MKSTIEDVSSVKKKLHIQVAPDTIAQEMVKAVADAAKKAKIHGFRPGKAPKAVVERHYAAEIENEVMNKLITDSYLQALQEHNLNPVDVPNITNISPFDKSAPLNFTAVVEVRPNIELGVYDGIEVKDETITVSDEELNQTIDRLRDMYAQLEVVEGRPLEKNDTAIIDFEGSRDGKTIEGAKAADYMLSLGSNSLIPGFEEQVVGMNRGETRTLNVTFPADYSNKELAGKDAQFIVTLKEIKKKVLPELNDEFAKDIGNNKSVDELKEGIKKDIEIRKKNELASSQREALLAKLVDAHTFDVPDGMVERELQSMARSQATRLARRGVDVKAFDYAKFREENKDLAQKRVKGLLLLDVIAEKEKLEVSGEEVNSAIAVMARSSGQTVAEVKKYYESLEGGLDNLKASLAREKTLSLLLSRAKKSYN
ncbi:MAG TPA: trigger factor [Nitrospirota bacterium]|nr:trigger factor [Nitrospirota bacterium]